ncbi:MAG: hypothetical protein AB7K09_20220 [Planctomycetota bacterium]
MSDDLDIKPFGHSNKRLLETFLRFPRKLHHRNRYWVPDWLPQRRELHHPRRNPSFAHLEVRWFLAYRKGDPIGRITAHINHNHNAHAKESAGFFGFFECEDDQGAASGLFDAAAAWLGEKGATVLRGPMSFTPHDEWGMLVDGRFEDSPTVQLPWNPRYYPLLCERAGFSKVRDLNVYEVSDWHWPDARIKRLAQRVRERHRVRLRPLRVGQRGWRDEQKLIRRFYDEAWDNVWGNVPLTDAEFAQQMTNLEPILHRDLCHVAEIDGKPVGLCLTLPDVHQVLTHTGGRTPSLLWHLVIRKSQFRFGDMVSRARVSLIGVDHPMRHHGLESVFYEAIFESLISRGIRSAEIGGIPDDHTAMNNAMRRIGGRVCKVYRIHERPIIKAAAPAADEPAEF